MMSAKKYIVVLTDIAAIRPSEEVNEASARQLAKNIAFEQAWIAPIPIDKGTGIVMDGNHRVWAGRLLGLTHLPCIHLDYADPRVSVHEWHTGNPYQIEKIFRAIQENRILPFKSTKHIFDPPLPQIRIPLESLVSTDG
ncbi:ParB N-terminal domain-containing protein [Janthinobacterium lividum]|uniref:ParB N-terminal domain-containing protein n=1 Tax=Janthinobacterium lividum TaxID=29581 RepID=UPI0015962979|nr:ParB N-terminal domain-containing protein [Janthinobacterium lividum]QKY12024.1 ParB N-terminal domain-containing protein [Janthinobacterium lividum]